MTSIFTDKGAALVAEAIKSGTSIQISQFAVGSGANEPVSTQTALQKEEYRAYINEMSRADDVLTLKLVIPAEAGASTEGFTINELGIFTAAGDLFTIAKVPTYQKTLISTITYSVKIDISKEAVVECKVDDTQVYVTHSLLTAKLLDYYTKTAADARFIIADPASVGSATQPVFLSNKKITASTATIGSGIKPIYLNAGTLTASNSTLGDATHGIYLSNGEFKVTDGITLDNAGSGVNPIYTTGGKITASTSSVGDADTPIYMKSGVLTAGNKKISFFKEYTLSNFDSTQALFNEIQNNPSYSIRIYINDKTKWLAGGTLNLDNFSSYMAPLYIDIRDKAGFVYSDFYDTSTSTTKSISIPKISGNGSVSVFIIANNGSLTPLNFDVTNAINIHLFYNSAWFGTAAINTNDGREPIIKIYATNSYQSPSKSIYTNLSTSHFIDIYANAYSSIKWYGVDSSTYALKDETELCANGSRMNLTRVIPQNKVKLSVRNGGEIIVNTNSNWILQQAANTRTANGVIWQY